MEVDVQRAGRERMARLVTKALEKPESPFSPPKWTNVTKVCGWVAVCGVIGGIAAFVATGTTSIGNSPSGDTLVNVGMAAFFLGLLCSGKVIYDWNKPNVADRGRPEKAMQAYLSSLRCGWWAGAAACLSWSAKDGTEIAQKEIAALDLDGVALPIDGETGLMAFWSRLIVSGRSFTCRTLKAEKLEEGRALVTAQVTVTLDLRRTGMGSRARQGGALIRNQNKVDIVGKWCVYDRDGVWFVLEAGFPEGAVVTRVA